jgi:hypothetical protein
VPEYKSTADLTDAEGGNHKCVFAIKAADPSLTIEQVIQVEVVKVQDRTIEFEIDLSTLTGSDRS